MGEKLTIQERIKLVFVICIYFHKNVHGPRLPRQPA